MPDATPTIEQHFAGKSESVRATYAAILKVARRLGEVVEDPKKTSIHLNRKSAFAGIATRKDSLILTIKSETDLESPRIRRHERASARRWHLEIPLASPSEVDAEIAAWLSASYQMSA